MSSLGKWMPDLVRRARRSCLENYRHRTAHVCPRPVLIGGNQKSGTTAIGALLAVATGLRFSNDPLWQAQRHDARPFLFTDLLEGRVALEDFIRRHRAYFAPEIIKDPDFAFSYADLRRCFPDAPEVFIVRDPRQNIRSILNRLGLPGHLDELGDGHRALLAGKKGWQAIVDGRGLGITEGNYISRLAQRWSAGVRCYLEQPASIEMVRYEDFLADKPGCIANLAERVGLPIVADIRKDQDRQYQPRGNCNVSLDAFFGQKNLDIIERVCAHEMALVGYTRPQSSASSVAVPVAVSSSIAAST
jgi:hypothetical protein